MDVPAVLGVLSPVGLIGLFFWLVWTGRMVPGRTVDRIQKQCDDRIAEIRADRDARLAESHEETQLWREAHRISEETRSDVAAQIRETQPIGQLAVRLLQALPSGGRGDQGATDAS